MTTNLDKLGTVAPLNVTYANCTYLFFFWLKNKEKEGEKK